MLRDKRTGLLGGITYEEGVLAGVLELGGEVRIVGDGRLVGGVSLLGGVLEAGGTVEFEDNEAFTGMASGVLTVVGVEGVLVVDSSAFGA